MSHLLASPVNLADEFAKDSAKAVNDRSGPIVNPNGDDSKFDPAGASLAGELFAGRYRIGCVLGNGGMGIVYSATHVELSLPVALKVIHPTLASSPEARARFCIEARAAAALRSPHILRVYDAGNLGADGCFMVMERLEGINLDELCRASGPLRVETAVDYVLQACMGLAEAHAIGIVHRDIKPENLFLSHYRCSAPLIKVMDFGIARWQGDEIRSGRLTNRTSSLGSPCYQSPEQMENASDVDERSDIWSLGLVLYELVTGVCPFEAESIQETCWKVLQGPRPSLVTLRPDLDPALDAVIQRCLELDRSKRYASVRQLASALRPLSSAGYGTPPASRVAAARAEKAAKGERSGAARARPGSGSREKHGRSAALLASAAFVLGIGVTTAIQVTDPQLRGVGTAVVHSSNAALRRAHQLVRRFIPAAPARTVVSDARQPSP